jgi:hypothetical protein
MQAIAAQPAIRPRASRGRPGQSSARRGASAARKAAARRRLIALTRLMDGLFEIPLVKRKFGLDPLIGLVPVLGDLIPAAIGLYLVFEARELGASRWLQARMVGNLLLDLLVGAVPVLGDFFDLMFRAHHRNLKLLQKELGEPYIDAEVR